MSTENKIKAGDVVVLKSDERHIQQMTVEYLDKDIADCVWFDKAEAKRTQFNVKALKVVISDSE